MMPISIHLSKVENSGPDWSSSALQVALKYKNDFFGFNGTRSFGKEITFF